MGCVVPAKPVELEDGTLFESFDIPLKLLSEEKFNQPWFFGPNNLTGVTEPISGSGLPGPAKFKLSFYKGNAALFLYFFIRAVAEMRVRVPRQEQFKQSKFLSFQAQNGGLSEQAAAYQDPNDPTKIFVTNPVKANQVLP